MMKRLLAGLAAVAFAVPSAFAGTLGTPIWSQDMSSGSIGLRYGVSQFAPIGTLDPTAHIFTFQSVTQPFSDNSQNAATTAWGQSRVARVANAAALATWTNYSFPVMRDDVGVTYSDSGQSCSAADGGTQIQPATGHCWTLNKSVAITPQLFGGLPGGTDSAAAFRAGITASLALNQSFRIPCGSYTLLSAVTANVPAGATASIRGDGHGCVTLQFPASHGFSFTMGDQYAGLLMSDLSLVTSDATGAYTAIAASLPTALVYSRRTGQPAFRFSNIQMRGADAQSNGAMYWGLGYNLTNLTDVEVGDNSTYTGADPVATATISIASPAVVTMANTFKANAAIEFNTTGALPTGLASSPAFPTGLQQGHIYYVLNPTSTSFNVSATPGGAAINTSGTQSGTQSVQAMGLGQAISAQGLTSPASYSGQVNLHGFQAWQCHKGFYYGDFLQGVVIDSGTNFTDCTYGVDAIQSPTGTPDQLVIADSQINSYAVGVNAPTMNGLMIHHNVFIISGGTGIVGAGGHYQIDHNFLQNGAYPTGTAAGTGINIVTGTLVGGVIDDNHFDTLAVPITITSNTYAFANITNNQIDSTSGTPWYTLGTGVIGTSISDPTVMTVAQLNSRIPCFGGAVTGARAVVSDSTAPTLMGGLTGGNSYTVNAICRGAAAAWVAD